MKLYPNKDVKKYVTAEQARQVKHIKKLAKWRKEDAKGYLPEVPPSKKEN